MEFYNRNDVFGLGTSDLNEIINELVIYEHLTLSQKN